MLIPLPWVYVVREDEIELYKMKQNKRENENDDER